MAVVNRDPSLYAPEHEAPRDWEEYRDDVVRRALEVAGARSVEVGERLARAGLSAAEVQGLDDLGPIPVLDKDDLPALQAERPPFGGMLAVSVKELRRIYRSPGPISDPEGRANDFWRVAPAVWAAGFRPGDVVLNTFSYHLTPGGHMLDAGFREAGCVVVPGGVGNSSGQVEMAVSVGATGYGGTPQFLLTLLEAAEEAGAGFPVERALVTGAPLPPTLRARLQEEHGVDVYQCYGTADAGILGYECEAKEGWHLGPEVAVEVLVPGTGAPAAPGEAGEVVVTSPNPVYPLVRFGTGDLSAWNMEPCSCGRTTPRLVGFLGRVGEGVKVRGMFVHPRQLAAALGGNADVARYRAVVRGAEGRDELTVMVEPARGANLDPEALAGRIRSAVQLRAGVEVVDPGTIDEGAGPLVDEREL